MNRELPNLPRVSSPSGLRHLPLPTFPALGLWACTVMPYFFIWVLGIERGPQGYMANIFSDWAISIVSTVFFFFRKLLRKREHQFRRNIISTTQPPTDSCKPSLLLWPLLISASSHGHSPGISQCGFACQHRMFCLNGIMWLLSLKMLLVDLILTVDSYKLLVLVRHHVIRSPFHSSLIYYTISGPWEVSNVISLWWTSRDLPDLVFCWNYAYLPVAYILRNVGFLWS